MMPAFKQTPYSSLTTIPPFPLAPKTQWQAADCLTVPDFHLKNWLLDTSSLTERLQSHCRQFRVQVLGQATAPLMADELLKMGAEPYLVREVILWGDDMPWVFARSLLPSTLCEQEHGKLANLGDRPLGSILFNDPLFTRLPFEITCLPEEHPLLGSLELSERRSLWGRRSRFQYQQWQMMVAEIFLPQSPAYKNMGNISDVAKG
ncbi:chorismate lyase [Aliiglaciecola sp. CAU 1673]|uniref:chorismate--pyruvate lyase family protein n=1 Tax=Aliiglaciecola sp. CAU 1673 TaxID=3032595 RepID=UPI0023DC824A|nr:chorismate lyase [Aliiglaciecola sp. CAU 1673]MDF2179263.1 chorismate lyase [Aliiglaciecola sp. CAU 1673]